ncbi:hypothetical protein GCM10020367_34870 [Streptomyces sannanensis]|uniref:Lipoprotein n=1 Tax=Streptomyces sannanensis TaxID=285536 RepID=A0ABP6SDD1_9ACTN
MIVTTKRAAFGIATAATAAVFAACSAPGGPGGAGGPGGKKAAQGPRSSVRLIGDGSTAYTGPQPELPEPERLKEGQTPPQFVVFSWDGAGEDGQRLFSHFREVARKHNAKMTYFLSGVYLLPKEKGILYTAPRHEAGQSEIGFNDREGIKDTLAQLRAAWREGNEIGTHFNGHFCGTDGGVGTWSVDEWKSEISQAKSFVKNWKTNSGLNAEQPLPFDYDRELIGGRTPCLEGQKNMMPAAKEMNFRYDSSGIGNQVWPGKDAASGLWDIPLQLVPLPGRDFETLSMDYNFMVNQSGTTQGSPSMHEYWGNQLRDGLLQAFDRAYKGNRAPLIIGNHFESWNGGTYMRALEQTIESVCDQRDVRCVSFRQLVDWLDVQEPSVLAKLRTLGVGEAPKPGWKTFLAARLQAAEPVKPAVAEHR